MRRTKQEVIDEITRSVAVGSMTVSRGSTEPKAVLIAVASRLNLGIDERLTKPQMAAAIVSAAGLDWDGSCDSRGTPSGGGSTVTLIGLERVLEATRLLVSKGQQDERSFGLLPDRSPLELEAEAILDVLARRLPVRIDGRVAIEEMRSTGGPWKQTEWPGFYFEHFGRSWLKQELGGKIGPTYGNTTFDYRLIRVFDIKTHTNGAAASIWLNDAEAVEAVVAQTGGIGFIVIEGHAEKDRDGRFRAWHEHMKGEPSAYARAARERGAEPRTRKVNFERTQSKVLYVEGLGCLRDGLADGWLRLKSQGRQADGGTRRDKFALWLDRVPGKVIVAQRAA